MKSFKIFLVFLFELFYNLISAIRSISKPRLHIIKHNDSLDHKIHILVNGPSLVNHLVNSDYENDVEYMCVNNFCENIFFNKIKPTHYVFADPNYWLITKNDPGYSELQRITNILSKISWNIIIYIPTAAINSSFCLELIKNKKIHIKYFNTRNSFGNFNKLLLFFYKYNFLMPHPGNVLVAAIYVAIMSGYTDIRLHGADHNWFQSIYVDDNNIPRFTLNHSVREVISGVPIYKDAAETEVFSMKDLFHDYARLFHSYDLIADFSNRLGIKIINCTKNSTIDSFERFY